MLFLRSPGLVSRVEMYTTYARSEIVATNKTSTSTGVMGQKRIRFEKSKADA